MTGTEKQVKWAEDIIKAVMNEIAAVKEERLAKANNQRFLARTGKTEEEFKEAVETSENLLKEYYMLVAEKAYNGNAGDIISHRFAFKVNNVKTYMLAIENDILAGNGQDKAGIRGQVEKMRKM